jgi:hypothetical protein
VTDYQIDKASSFTLVKSQFVNLHPFFFKIDGHFIVLLLLNNVVIMFTVAEHPTITIIFINLKMFFAPHRRTKMIQIDATVSRDGNLTAKVPISDIPPGNYSLRLAIHKQLLSDEASELESEPAEIMSEIMPTFAELLLLYMNRIRANDRDVARAIGDNKAKDGDKSIAHQTIYNWTNGAMPRSKSCPYVQDIAKFLRLTAQEKALFLKASGCSEADVYVDYPEAIFTDYIKGLFDTLLTKPVLLLLTQAGWDEPPCRNALLLQAEKKYGPENVLHIQPPTADLSEDVDKCFAYMGNQLEFENVKDALSFSGALEARLKETDTLFLLVSRFEQGMPLLRQKLAKVLRSLSDVHTHRLHIILCGGETLESLKYKDGQLSLLNIAKDERWPEMSRDEVYALCDYRFKELPLDNPLVDELLTISGGHPQLLDECLTMRKEQPDLPLSDYPERLSQCEYAQQPFIQLTHYDKAMQQEVHRRLSQKGDLGKFPPYIRIADLHWLYWKNLLVVRDIDGKRRLFWRCEALRMAGQEILGEQDELEE